MGRLYRRPHRDCPGTGRKTIHSPQSLKDRAKKVAFRRAWSNLSVTTIDTDTSYTPRQEFETMLYKALLSITLASVTSLAIAGHHKEGKIEDLLLSTPKQNKKNLFIKPSSFKKHMSKNIFFEKVNNLKKEIINGEIFQAVLSQRFSAKYEIDPFKFYRALRSINPSPYLVFLNLKKYQIICSSPETMINVKNKKVTLRPIAGTRKRGKNHNEDIQLRNDLLNDTKELAEHLMLVDLGRNDVGQISKKGTVNVTEKNIIEYYSHVMHIVSNVTGELRNNLTPIDVLYAGLPAGTVSGAPKIRALELLEELEEVNREFYSGSVCYLDINGDMDSCINLRTAMIKDKTIYTQSGAGIVYDSIDKNEYLECINKANAIFEAYKIAHQIK